MSYDLAFWIPNRPDKKSAHAIYNLIRCGRNSSSLKRLPLKSIIAEGQGVFSDFKAKEALPGFRTSSGRCDVAFSNFHVLLMIYGGQNSDTAHMVNILFKHGCYMFDPQTDQLVPPAQGTEMYAAEAQRMPGSPRTTSSIVHTPTGKQVVLRPVYRLENDRELCKLIQDGAVLDSTLGFSNSPHPPCSRQWFSAIRAKRIQAQSVSGPIVEVGIHPMRGPGNMILGDIPEFRINSDGLTTVWTVRDDLDRYVVGKYARIEFVFQTLKVPNDIQGWQAPILIAIDIEK